MYKILIIQFLILVSIKGVHAQESLDSIYSSNETLGVHIKEVTEEVVRFSYPGEDILNSLKLSSVKKIVFSSGRIQTFAEAPVYRQVVDGTDWEYVEVVQVEDQLKGLYQLDQVSAKAKAMTGLGSVGKMENRAMMKLKIETAMNGGNVVYITQQQSATRSQVSNSSSVVSGVAYSDRIPEYSSISSIIKDQDIFQLIEKHELGVNSTDISVKALPGESIKFNRIEKSGNLTYVYANIPNEDTEKFRISYIDNEKIILVYRDKKHIYNLVFRI